MSSTGVISTLQELEEWLTFAGVVTCRKLAARALGRALPSICSNEIVASEDKLFLTCCRAGILTSVAGKQDHGMQVAFCNSAFNTVDQLNLWLHAAPRLRYSQLLDGVLSALSTIKSSVEFEDEFDGAEAAAFNTTRVVRSDRACIEDANVLNLVSDLPISDSPLWLEGRQLSLLNEDSRDRSLTHWQITIDNREHQESWGFWRDWYQGFLDGKPLDWELQRRVALIDDAIWEAGPEAVAKEIECIRAKFELEQEIAALKEQLSAQQQVSTRNPQIGDNGGPPLDGPAAKAFKKDLVLIWSDIEELESELSKPEPSPPVLKRIAQSFSEIALRIAAYCGTTLDTIVKEGAKTIGKGAGGLIVAEYVKPGTVEAVAKAIGKYLSTHAN